ncbi:hypothetical protein HBZS_107920 [Helicobacter bizzozeronii CCUG 35545]|nr:hypothetical protein HBZS_107920 [Helicobacter bizzozeronii CCUG 35545]
MNTRYCSFCNKPESTLHHHRRLIFSSRKSGKDTHICEYCVEYLYKELHTELPTLHPRKFDHIEGMPPPKQNPPHVFDPLP